MHPAPLSSAAPSRLIAGKDDLTDISPTVLAVLTVPALAFGAMVLLGCVLAAFSRAAFRPTRQAPLPHVI